MDINKPGSIKARIFTLFLLIASVSICVPNQKVYAQVDISSFQLDTSATYKITLMNGEEFVGKVISKTNTVLKIRTSSIPSIEIPVSSIKKIEAVKKEDMRNGSYWFPNPNATRYLISPTATNLKKGEGYYQNLYLLFNSINYGVTDYFSIGGGFELISTFSPDVTPIFMLTPKFGFELNEKSHAGAGLLFIGAAGEGSLGIAYGLYTYGDSNTNFTGGLGFGFVDKEFSSRPVLTLSGMHRVKRRLSLVSENWIIPDLDDSYYTLLSYGVRFFGEKLSTDLGFINNADIAEFLIIGIPYVDFVVKF